MRAWRNPLEVIMAATLESVRAITWRGGLHLVSSSLTNSW